MREEQTQGADASVRVESRTLVMSNGATVHDWLGTAETAAKVAGMYLQAVKDGVSGAGKLLEARAQLEQATYEIDEIIRRLGREEG